MKRVTCWLGLLLGACVPDATPHEEPPTAPCGLSFAEPCRACASAHCCAEQAACADDVGCKSLATCLSQCAGDPPCRSTCAQNNVSGEKPMAAALAACLAHSCEEECGLKCGALDLAGPPSASACVDCLSNTSCEETKACASDPDCQAYVACRRNCQAGDCIGACQAAHDPDADYCYLDCGENKCVRPCSSDYDELIALYSKVYEAYQHPNCANACQARREWSCVGRSAPATTQGERHLTLALEDRLYSAPAPNVLVALCDSADLDCASPYDEATSDPTGIVRLVDRTRNTNGAQLGLSGFLKLTADGLYPTRAYWGFRLTERSGALGVPVPIFSRDSIDNYDLDTPDRGILMALALDCVGLQAMGVLITVSDDEGAVRISSAAGLASDLKTTEDGTMVFKGVKPGTHTVTARLEPESAPLVEIDVQVRAGELTQVALAPR